MSQHGLWSGRSPEKTHKHRYISLPEHSIRRHLLRTPLRVVDFETAEKSRLLYGAESLNSEAWTLTPLGLLHSLFGVTVKVVRRE